MRLHKPVPPQQQPHLQSFFQGGIPADGRFAPNAAANAGAGFDDGGPVTGEAADQGSTATVTPTTPGQWSDEDEARLQATNNTMENSMLSRGLNYSLGKVPSLSGKRYDDGGQVSPDAYLQWPNQAPIPQTGFADGGDVSGGDDSGGQVDPTAMVNPSGGSHLAELADHAGKVYDDYHAKLEAAFNAAQQGGADNDTDDTGGGSDNDADDQGYAQGGGIPAPAGPAGPGVKPQAPTGNAGRPNWTAPNPAQTSQEKNYTQNVTSRPATSPGRGTAYAQPAPDGSQRGQEWYGKGASPYGAGRKKQNG